MRNGTDFIYSFITPFFSLHSVFAQTSWNSFTALNTNKKKERLRSFTISQFNNDGNTFIVDGFLSIVINVLVMAAENKSVVMNNLLEVAENEAVVMDLSVCGGSHLAIVHESQLNVDDFKPKVRDRGQIIDNNDPTAINVNRYVCCHQPNFCHNKLNMGDCGQIIDNNNPTAINLNRYAC